MLRGRSRAWARTLRAGRRTQAKRILFEVKEAGARAEAGSTPFLLEREA